jgi:hypothetical protein
MLAYSQIIAAYSAGGKHGRDRRAADSAAFDEAGKEATNE